MKCKFREQEEVVLVTGSDRSGSIPVRMCASLRGVRAEPWSKKERTVAALRQQKSSTGADRKQAGPLDRRTRV